MTSPSQQPLLCAEHKKLLNSNVRTLPIILFWQSDTLRNNPLDKSHHLPVPQPQRPARLQTHQGGRAQCPAFKQTRRYCLKVGHFARVCHSRLLQQKPPAAKAITTTEDTDQDPVEPITPALTTISLNQIKAVDPAPTVMMHIITPNGSCQTQVLPDLGADISAAGEQILSQLNEHRNNLLPSEFAPHAANGQKIKSMGKMCVQFRLAGKEHSEEMYIFPNMRGVIMSWKAA